MPPVDAAALPLDVLFAHAGEQVILRPGPAGAKLGIVLCPATAHDTVRAALRLGFSSAVVFDAGLATSADGRHVLLSRWLPGVTAWPAAQEPLARLLDQCAAWRAWLQKPGPGAPPADPPFDQAGARQRARLLGLLHGKQA